MREIKFTVLATDETEGIDLGAYLKQNVPGVLSVLTRTGPPGQKGKLFGITDPTNCPDCGVKPGEPHLIACDVARCTECGAQYMGCGHPNGFGHIWTGQWPGSEEVEEGLATDPNDLAMKGLVKKELRWDGQRWQKP